MERWRTLLGLAASAWMLAPSAAVAQETGTLDGRYEYKLLATNKTSTMEKELNETAEAGFRFEGVMGGQTGFGGKEVVSILSRLVGAPAAAAYEYKLCATTKTSTMQKEISEAAGAGYRYRGQTVTDTMFGGQEVVVIMERVRGEKVAHFEYKLLATNKTSTMQKEITEAAQAGFVFTGITVGSTGFGGREVVLITQRRLLR